MGTAISSQDLVWQAWPSATTGESYITRKDKPNAIEEINCAITRAPFTAGGLDVEIANGRLRVRSEGRHRKFVETVAQVSYNGSYCRRQGQETMFVTERAVFRGRDPLELVEVA